MKLEMKSGVNATPSRAIVGGKDMTPGLPGHSPPNGSVAIWHYSWVECE